MKNNNYNNLLLSLHVEQWKSYKGHSFCSKSRVNRKIILCSVAMFTVYLFKPDVNIDRPGKQKMLNHCWTHVQ